MSTLYPPAEDVTGRGMGEPAERAVLITPSDDVPLSFVTRAIRVGTAGDIAVLMVSGDVVVIPDIVAGEYIPVRATKVYATSTTASGIVGLS